MSLRTLVVAALLAFGAHADELKLAPGQSSSLTLPIDEPGATYAINVGIMHSGLAAEDTVSAELQAPGLPPLRKSLHAGDPSYYIPFRAAQAGQATLTLTRSNAQGTDLPLSTSFVRLGGADSATRFEAEPNDSPQSANAFQIGTTVEGSADDVDYLDNVDEGKVGLDWFRIDFASDTPKLVLFELDIPDRDVSVNLRMYTLDASGQPVPYLEGKDPMEIVHDRERERYSKSISRTLGKGTYYLQVNANHPRYQIRSFEYPVPPYTDPALAVEVGLRYVMDVGDAWFAQVPREGNIYRRVQNMHETAMRCTACHPSVFSTEPNLVAQRNGYPIPSKTNFRYVVERIYNSITPFYGEDDLWWQRFIAIPLQSQGKQGGILMDFEAQISGRETKIPERFGPLLRAAWATRTTLPSDEANGVVPADSKFGFAWRDWRVLKEVARRTGDASFEQAANNIERIVTAPEAAARIETLQDKIHLMLGMHYMDQGKYAERIKASADELFDLQGADGGWHEEGKKEKQSAVYTTGQLLYSLMEAGFRPENDARMQRGLHYLLAKQQAFGGWYQTDSHENFKTPMRESRYALMALAQGFPRPGGPRKGLGTLDNGPSILPAADASPAECITRFENIIDAPADHGPGIAKAAAKFLNRPEPNVRAAAAELIGRVGGAVSVAPLLPLLRDPSKLVWRDAAWALRALGNRGVAADVLFAALKSDDGLVRRSASRAFAYQFQEMDNRLDIAREFKGLINDPDLLTRLQAIRTLRQWWYRSSDPGFRREVVDTFIARMGVEGERPEVRINLAQNMYVLLDENQDGGVSMERNLRDVPEEMAQRVYAARTQVEKDILLTPVLDAIGHGNALQREALLNSFDGSFFKGRSYARLPEAMIDVGNDREFGFKYTPNQAYLADTLGKLVELGLPAGPMSNAIQLASFFKIPSTTPQPQFQLALLNAQFHDDASVRSAARTSVHEQLLLRPGTSEDLIHRVADLLGNTDTDARAAVIAALARSAEAQDNAFIRAAITKLADEDLADASEDATLLPLATSAILSDDQALGVLQSSWRALKGHTATEKLAVVSALAQRKGLYASLSATAPEEDAIQRLRKTAKLLERAATDAEPAVRERVFEVLPTLNALHKSERASGILYAGLSDESPAIRTKSLALAGENDAVWQEEDVHEYVLKLLIDADPKIRQAALATVRDRDLAKHEKRYLARVKALVDGDPALRDSAAQVLSDAGADLASLAADAKIAESRQPDILFFRDHVNHYFYEKAVDNNACVDCHATHTILGLSERPSEGVALSDDAIVANYRSLLKVTNTADPEQSLVLRKPRSPFGTGVATKDSPTGITHVGGIRWQEDTANEAYQAVLAFVRSAQQGQPRISSTALADSYSPMYPPQQGVDGNPNTIWHTEYVGAVPGYPHELVITLAEATEIAGVTYTPRQESDSGWVKDFEIYVSTDGQNWGEPQAKGTWTNDPTPKTAFLHRQQVKYIKLRGLSEVNAANVMSAAELEPLRAPTESLQAAQK